ncbi:MAG: sigma-70 family RNA polymerase sigma factor [Terriglobia bacterium]
MRPRGQCEGKAVQDRERLLVDMLPLVKRVALRIRKRLPAHVELDDLFSDGVLGLVDAVTKFDASKPVRLETYARHRIRGSILDGLRAADPERVSVLLGHSSVKITEKHYAPWVRERQEQMEADVRRAWKVDPILNRTIFAQPENSTCKSMKTNE